LLVNTNNQDQQDQRVISFKEIQSTISADEFWNNGIREKFIKKLCKLVENDVTTYKDISKLNTAIFSEKRTREGLNPSNNPNGQLFVAQFRGINYMSDRWNISSRRYHYKMNETHRDQFSESVLRQLPYNFYDELNEQNDYYNKAEYSQALVQNSKNMKQAYAALQATEPMIEECIALKCSPYLFNSVADFLQSGYTNGISQHLLELKSYREEQVGNIEKHTLNSFNYAISTSDCPNHALRYALGLKTYYADNFAVHYNKNGKIVNSHVGKIYIILQTLEEFNLPNHINHVLRMAHEARVPISKVGGVDIASELENDFIGSIPGKNVVYQLRLKFPDFSSAYKSIYAIKYGMNKKLYNYFSQLIKKTWNNDPTNSAHSAAIQLLKEWLCYYYEVLLLQIAQDKAKKLGGNLVYVRHDGTQSLTPDFVPFNPGDAHLADRNKVHVLQNFRSLVANKQEPMKTNDNSNIDSVIDDALDNNLQALSLMVALEPRTPGGFGKITDLHARYFYVNNVSNIVDDDDKKKAIIKYILTQHKHTLTPYVHVATPFLFSKKRTSSSLTESSNDKKLKSQKISM
jgi:hypothetical protein